MTPTPEQLSILDATRLQPESLMISALAGTGKTTTLTLLSKELSGGLALAFNVARKEDLQKRLPPTWTAKTFNGLGHSAFGKAIGKRLQVDDRKLGKLVTQVAKSYGEVSRDEWDNIRTLVSRAMLAGIVPRPYPQRGLTSNTPEAWERLCEELWLEPSERLISIAHDTLSASVKQSFEGIVSYDDQIYCSVVFGGIFQRYPNVLVDEAQDLNSLNHVQLHRSAAGRIFSVGDPRQAIYSFRGAHSRSMSQIRTLRLEWLDLPLNTTFRCPQTVVSRVNDYVPEFRAAPSNPQGQILSGYKSPREPELPFPPTRTHENRTWSWTDVPQGEVAILSRNNAQLISMAFKLLRGQVGCKMLGRDIGKSLLALCRKIAPDPATPAEALAKLIEDWRQNQRSLAEANGKEEKVAGIEDRAASLVAVLEGANCRDGADLEKAIAVLFARDSAQVVLSTVHRSKGLEWETVIHLDPWRIPSRRSLQESARGNPIPLEQEHNLQYVCETRTKHTLILANLEDYNG